MISHTEIETFALFCVTMVSEHKACVIEEMVPIDAGIRIRLMALGSGQRVGYDFQMADIVEWLDRRDSGTPA